MLKNPLSYRTLVPLTVAFLIAAKAFAQAPEREIPKHLTYKNFKDSVLKLEADYEVMLLTKEIQGKHVLVLISPKGPKGSFKQSLHNLKNTIREKLSFSAKGMAGLEASTLNLAAVQSSTAADLERAKGLVPYSESLADLFPHLEKLGTLDQVTNDPDKLEEFIKISDKLNEAYTGIEEVALGTTMSTVQQVEPHLFKLTIKQLSKEYQYKDESLEELLKQPLFSGEAQSPSNFGALKKELEKRLVELRNPSSQTNSPADSQSEPTTSSQE